jgi:hypothetical protein
MAGLESDGITLAEIGNWSPYAMIVPPKRNSWGGRTVGWRLGRAAVWVSNVPQAASWRSPVIVQYVTT